MNLLSSMGLVWLISPTIQLLGIIVDWSGSRLLLKCYSDLCFSLHSPCSCIISGTYYFLFCGSILISFPDLCYPLIDKISSVVILDWENFCLPGEICPCLEMCLVITTGASIWERLEILPTSHNAQDCSPKWGITWLKFQQGRYWKTLF